MLLQTLYRLRSDHSTKITPRRKSNARFRRLRFDAVKQEIQLNENFYEYG